jgi:hypothetical protein
LPSRLNRVRVATSREVIEISWIARNELLERLRKAGGALEVIRAFEGIGASRPVELTDDGKQVLLEALSRWVDELDGDLPRGVAELRREILDDLDAAGFWRE